MPSSRTIALAAAFAALLRPAMLGFVLAISLVVWLAHMLVRWLARPIR